MPEISDSLYLLSTNEAAVLTGLSPATVRVWVHRRQLTPVACHIVNRGNLFDPADVIATEGATRSERQRRKGA